MIAGSAFAPRAEPTVAAGFVRGLMELAVSKGASRTLLAGRAGLDPAELVDQDRRIPLIQVWSGESIPRSRQILRTSSSPISG